LLLRSLLAVQSVDPGFEPRHVLTLRMTSSPGSAANAARRQRDVLERLRALPNVEYAGAINDLFELGKPNLVGLRAIEGRPVEAPERWTALSWKDVSGDYFQAMGTALLKGRYFSEQDNAGSPLV